MLTENLKETSSRLEIKLHKKYHGFGNLHKIKSALAFFLISQNSDLDKIKSHVLSHM